MSRRSLRYGHKVTQNRALSVENDVLFACPARPGKGLEDACPGIFSAVPGATVGSQADNQD